MGTPQLNPLAAKLLGGADFRKKLQAQLLEAAARTDDPAYRRRLEEIADGKRPLRTLMEDPAFQQEKGLTRPGAEAAFDAAVAAAERPRGTAEELQARAQAQLEEMGYRLPSLEEAQAVFEDVVALKSETDHVLAAERLTGWGGSQERVEEETRREREAEGGDPQTR